MPSTSTKEVEEEKEVDVDEDEKVTHPSPSTSSSARPSTSNSTAGNNPEAEARQSSRDLGQPNEPIFRSVEELRAAADQLKIELKPDIPILQQIVHRYVTDHMEQNMGDWKAKLLKSHEEALARSKQCFTIYIHNIGSALRMMIFDL
jgi:hypothetical protein